MHMLLVRGGGGGGWMGWRGLGLMIGWSWGWEDLFLRARFVSIYSETFLSGQEWPLLAWPRPHPQGTRTHNNLMMMMMPKNEGNEWFWSGVWRQLEISLALLTTNPLKEHSHNTENTWGVNEDMWTYLPVHTSLDKYFLKQRLNIFSTRVSLWQHQRRTDTKQGLPFANQSLGVITVNADRNRPGLSK